MSIFEQREVLDILWMRCFQRQAVDLQRQEDGAESRGQAKHLQRMRHGFRLAPSVELVEAHDGEFLVSSGR